MGDDDHLDGRARFGCACGVASLLVLVYHPTGLFLGPLGVIVSLSSLISVDDPPTARTRRAAITGAALAAAAFAYALVLALTSAGSRA